MWNKLWRVAFLCLKGGGHVSPPPLAWQEHRYVLRRTWGFPSWRHFKCKSDGVFRIRVMQVFSLGLGKFIALGNFEKFCVDNSTGWNSWTLAIRASIWSWRWWYQFGSCLRLFHGLDICSFNLYNLWVYLYLEESIVGTKLAAAHHCSHPCGSCSS